MKIYLEDNSQALHARACEVALPVPIILLPGSHLLVRGEDMRTNPEKSESDYMK